MQTSNEYHVIRTLHTYCQAMDEKDLDRIMALYADDIVFDIGGVPNEGRLEGKEAVTGLYETLTSTGIGFTEDWMRAAKIRKHIALNPIVLIDGDTARAQSDWMVLMLIGKPDEEGGRIGLAGRWNDELRRVGDDDWQFTYRRIYVQVPGVSDPLRLDTPAAYRYPR